MLPLNDTAGDSDDLVVVDRDDVSNYNPEQILPQPPETILRIRSWLKPTPYDIAAGEYRKHLSSHVAGTGAWLTSSTAYQSWLHGDEHGLLWIRGIPGSGKSVMAANLIDELTTSNPGCPVLFFFFRQIIDANHAPEALLRDWMDQLLPYSPPLQKQLVLYVEERRSVDSLSMDDLWKDLRMAFADLPGRVFCVGDALDEMDRGHDAFLKELGTLGQWQPDKVKVLITSRPVPSVEMPLRNVPCLHLRLEERLVDVDISTYVRFALSTSSIPESDWQVITDAVPGRANGLFLYAKLAMDAFLEPGARVNSVLAHLPQDLNALYTDLLHEHARRSGVAPNIQRLILQSVTHAVRPLRLLELAEMIKVCSADGAARDLKATKDLIRAACGPLLEILADETVSVVHHSFTEYLKGTTRAENGSGYPILHKGPVHAEMSLACLRYLQSGCFGEQEADDEEGRGAWDGWIESDSDVSAIDVTETGRRLRHPFFNYAASNWHRHIVSSESAGHDQAIVSAEVRKFLGNREVVEAWLRNRWPRLLAPQRSNPGFVTQLHIAAKVGLLSYTKELLEDSDVNAGDDYGMTPIYWASREGHAAIVCELVRAGADPNQADDINGFRPLHMAAQFNRHEAARVLLELGVDPLAEKAKEGRAGSTTDDTPFLLACRYGHVESVDAFLSFIKDLRVVHHALASTARLGRPEIIARILRHPGVDVNAAPWGDTPLFLACGAVDAESVKILLQAGADPNFDCKGNPGRCYEGGPPAVREREAVPGRSTCLHKLCSLDYHRSRLIAREEGVATARRDIFLLLLEAGADIHQPGQGGSTPLHCAVSGAPNLTGLLLDAGADPNATDSLGNAALHKARRLESIVPLVESGRTDINQRADDGQTPLHRIVRSFGEETILKFLEYGPDCNIADNEGNTALHIVILSQRSSGPVLVEALLKHGADPNIRNHEGLTPLLCLRDPYEHTLESVGMLVAAGADINAVDKSGATLLLRPAHPQLQRPRKGPYPDIQTLIKEGADVSARDFDGRTLLHTAIGDYNFGTMTPRQFETTRLDFIISLGLDVNSVDYRGNGLLHELALCHQNHDQQTCGKATDLWKRLVSLGLSLDQKNHAGRTPLHILCATSNQAIEQINHRLIPMPIDFVISETADVDAVDGDGVTALHLAVTVGQLYTKKLLDAGADPAAETDEGLTPLHLASRSRQSNVVGLLLDAMRKRQEQSSTDTPRSEKSTSPSQWSPEPVIGVDAEAKGSTGRITPLYYACRSGRPETVALLLEAGADAKARNVLAACAGFESEDNLWWDPRLWEDHPANGCAVALKLDDQSRPGLGKEDYCGDPREMNTRRTARLDEIVDMLAEHGADVSAIGVHGEIYHDLISRNTRDNTEYTEALLTAAEESGSGDLVGSARATTVLAFSKHMHQYQRKASIHALRKFKLANPDVDDRDLFRRIILRRDYHLVEELARLGAPFLPVPGGKKTCHLSFLIQKGFTSLIDKVGTLAAASQLETGDWHFYGEESRPGLWFAGRDQADAHSPMPFIVEAVARDLPNMPIVRLLVEKFGVDVNEIHYMPLDSLSGSTSGPTGSALHFAARGSSWWHAHQALPYLLKAGADVDSRDQDGQTPLHAALDGGWEHHGPFGLDAAEMLIDAGADVNAVDGAGRSCLSSAQHEVNMARLLIARGASVTVDEVLFAVQAGNVPFLEALLSRGFDVNTFRVMVPKSERGRAKSIHCDPKLLQLFPLYHAAVLLVLPVDSDYGGGGEFEVNARIVQTLLEHGADPFAKFNSKVNYGEEEWSSVAHTNRVPDGFEECTILHELVMSGVMIDQFLDIRGLDIDHRDSQGRTLLHAACRGFDGLDYVLGSQSNSGTKKDERVTLLQRLLSLGADIRARDNRGRNILHHIIGNIPRPLDPDNYEVSLGAAIALAPDLVNLPDKDGKMPLHYAAGCAAMMRTPEAATALLAAGADPCAADNEGNTPLHALAYHLGTEPLRSLLKDLVERGADINAHNSRGETPLFSFASRARYGRASRYAPYTGGVNHPDFSEEGTAEMLAGLGADFFARDKRGRGLLHFSAGGDAERFRELVALGLDVMVEDEAQQTAIDVAAACGNRGVLKLFEKDKGGGGGD